jgi:aryl-alcohol dehydrogenase-like predicted oxidoreductase
LFEGSKKAGEKMKYRSLGKSGIGASVVGLGAWAIGGWMWGGADEAESVRAIHAAIDAGMNLIDTAPVYGFGLSEQVVGKAIRDRRDKVVLATKCGLVWHEERGEFFFASDEKHPTDDGQIKVYRCLAPDTIRREVEWSLKRLGTDYIDLLQTHWQESTTPIAATMQTLMELKREGKIRAIGCSNATPEQMDEYRAAGQLDVDQELFSILDRKHGRENLPYCAKHKTAFFAYSPLAQGLLTGRIGPERTFLDGDQRRGKPRFSSENRLKIQRLVDGFRPIAERHGVTPAQLAIAWTVSQKGCTHALVGARTARQAAENAKAGAVALSTGELQAMGKAIEEQAADIP